MKLDPSVPKRCAQRPPLYRAVVNNNNPTSLLALMGLKEQVEYIHRLHPKDSDLSSRSLTEECGVFTGEEV